MASGLVAPVDLGGGVSGSGSTTITVTGDAYAGETLLVVVAFADTTRTLTAITDTQGNTYTLTGPFDGGSFRYYFGTAHAPAGNPVGEPIIKVGQVITLNQSSAVYPSAAKAIRFPAGLKLTSPLDVSTTVNSGTSTSPSTPASGVLAQADEIIIGCQASAGTSAQTASISSPFTAIGSKAVLNGLDLLVGYLIVTSNASQTMNGTLSTSRAWGSMLRSYKAGTFPDTLRFSANRLAVDVSTAVRALSSVRLEVDMIEASVRNSYLSLEADTRGGPTQLGQFLVEVDVKPPSIGNTRPPPRIIG